MMSPIYESAKLTPRQIRIESVLKELHDTWGYTTEEQNDIREQIESLFKIKLYTCKSPFGNGLCTAKNPEEALQIFQDYRYGVTDVSVITEHEYEEGFVLLNQGYCSIRGSYGTKSPVQEEPDENLKEDENEKADH